MFVYVNCKNKKNLTHYSKWNAFPEVEVEVERTGQDSEHLYRTSDLSLHKLINCNFLSSFWPVFLRSAEVTTCYSCCRGHATPFPPLVTTACHQKGRGKLQILLKNF